MLGACSRSAETSEDIAFDTPLDSILLSDPAVLADSATQMYYMTGTGGKLWKSRDLEMWAGPYDVLEVDTTSWMGSRPEVWAAELHRYGDRYYYFATITNNSIIVDTINGIAVPRRASHVFVSDRPDGPYRPAGT
ncbi:MAG: family 43 glycosylhydrolase, partial [Muribaculaceae bacterium]|nr:family 43 glycosylhydrolase [Muribaculaceae bacterium]